MDEEKENGRPEDRTPVGECPSCGETAVGRLIDQDDGSVVCASCGAAFGRY